jgi:hypothetical protein
MRYIKYEKQDQQTHYLSARKRILCMWIQRIGPTNISLIYKIKPNPRHVDMKNLKSRINERLTCLSAHFLQPNT